MSDPNAGNVNGKGRTLGWGLSLFCGALLAAVGGCRIGPAFHIKIVSSLPMRGSALIQSQTMVNAIHMALDEAGHAAGPFSIDYEAWDDAIAPTGQWDKTQEEQNAERAVADPNVMVYIGTFNSGAARIAIPITNPANLVMVSPSATYTGLTQGGAAYVQPGEPDCFYPNHVRNFCRLVPNDVMQGKADASWAQELGVKTVFVVHDKDAYGAGLAEVFEKQCPTLGLTLVGEAIVNPDDVQPAVAQVRQANADLVYFGGNTQSGAGVVLRTMRELGVRSRFMGPDGIRETAFLDAAGATAEGTFASLGAMPVEKLPPRAKEWYDRYKQQYQGAPEPYTLYAYEATRVILAGIARAGVKDRVHIRDAIMGTHDYHGLLGTWSFTPEGDTSIRDIAGYQVHNHVFEFRQMLKSQ